MRYSPNAAVWASAGFDGKVFLYEGKDSELIGEIKDGDANAHSGGIYGLSFSRESDKFLTSSGDKTCKLWDLETKTCVQEITAHRKKFDESIFAVAFHPSKPFIASAGADALAKVFV